MGDGLCIAAKVIHAPWEAALHKWCQQVVLLAACAQGRKVKWARACYHTTILFLKVFLADQNSSILGKRQILIFLLSTFRHVLLDTEHMKVQR